DTTVIVGGSAINGLSHGVTLTSEEGSNYTFKLADDVDVTAETIAPEWKLNGNVAAYMIGASGAFFSLGSDSITIDYTAQTAGKSSVELAGVSSTVNLSVEDSVISINSTAIDPNGVTVTGNADNYGFNLGDEFNGKFFGTSGVDNITVQGAAYINGLSGNDIISVMGNSATVDVSADDDLINVNNTVTSFAVAGFSAGDTISGVKGTSIATIDGGIKVGSLSIFGITDIAATNYSWSSATTSATYYEVENAGASISGTDLIYTGSDSIAKLFTIAGLSATTAAVNRDGKVVTLTIKEIGENKDGATISGDYNYIFALSGVATEASAIESAWTLSGTTAVYSNGGSGAYYDLDDSNTVVTYIAQVGGESQFAIAGISDTTGMTPEDGVITLSENNYEGDGVTILGGDSSLTLNNTASDKKVTGSDETDNIINSGENVTVNGGDGADSITNNGASSTVDGGAGDDTISNSGENVSVNGGEDNDTITNEGNNVTIDGGAGDDTISNSGNNVSVNGGNDNDTITNEGNNVTVTGGDGNDSINFTGTSGIIEMSDGYDTVNYAENAYKIDAPDAYETMLADNGDLIITSGDQTLLVDGSANMYVTLAGEDGADDTVIYAGVITEKDMFTWDNEDKSQATAATLNGSTEATVAGKIMFTGRLLSTMYSDTVVTLVASEDANNEYPIYMEGNDNDNVIKANDNGSTQDGGAGNDTLIGGAGNDSFKGGDGNDVFSVGGGEDVIADYSDGDSIVGFYDDFRDIGTITSDNGINIAGTTDGEGLTLSSVDSTDTVNIDGQDYVFDEGKMTTADGKGVSLFGNDDEIDLGSDEYTDATNVIARGGTINAAENGGAVIGGIDVTLTANDGSDTMVYIGGDVRINNFDSANDKIDLYNNNYQITDDPITKYGADKAEVTVNFLDEKGTAGQIVVEVNAYEDGTFPEYIYIGYKQVYLTPPAENMYNDKDLTAASGVRVYGSKQPTNNGTYGDFGAITTDENEATLIANDSLRYAENTMSGSEYFTELTDIYATRENCTFIGNDNQNLFHMKGGTQNSLTGGLANDTFIFKSGGGVIYDFGVGGNFKLEDKKKVARASSTTDTGYDRTDPSTYQAGTDILKLYGEVTSILYISPATNDASFHAYVTYEQDDNTYVIKLDNLYLNVKQVRYGKAQYNTLEDVIENLNIWDTSTGTQTKITKDVLTSLSDVVDDADDAEKYDVAFEEIMKSTNASLTAESSYNDWNTSSNWNNSDGKTPYEVLASSKDDELV
nr:hypothetical protein [Selenomonadaceae bacterium]